jgi:hypothetical protein
VFDDGDFVIRAELRQDERLLWSGQPPQGLRLQTADAWLIPFSLLWGGFVIFWEASAIRIGAPLFFVLWGVPFIVVGLYFIFGRFWVDAKQRAATYYGITDSRIIIVSGLFSRSIRSLNIRTLTEVSLTKRRDGSGTIYFGPMSSLYAWWGGASWSPGMSRYMPPSIEVESNVQEVYDRIMAAQKTGNATA